MATVVRSSRFLAARSRRGLQWDAVRTMIANREGTGPPRVLITGGLGQLGRGLAKEMRYPESSHGWNLLLYCPYIRFPCTCVGVVYFRYTLNYQSQAVMSLWRRESRLKS